MTLDRIIGGIVVAFGGFLLLYFIPAHVRVIENRIPYPAMFPQMAAWMFIGLGLVQMLSGKAEFEFPSGRQFLAFLGVVFLTLIAVLFVEKIGYLPVMITFMAAIVIVSHERRPFWAAIMIIALPIGVWLLFEQVLQRALP
ncbi:MAG: tripartite tricarboxylate transporter TctB family protein [Paracoccaceae bacterium]